MSENNPILEEWEMIWKNHDEFINQAIKDFKSINSPYRGNYLAVVMRSVLEKIWDENIEKLFIKELVGKDEIRPRAKCEYIFTRGVSGAIFDQVGIKYPHHKPHLL